MASDLRVRAIQVSWWVELDVRPGCLDEFEILTGEMVASAREESGVLAYQRFISDDRQTVHVHERYENSDAALAHVVKFAAVFGDRYASLVERKRFIVFGEPSDPLRTLLDSYGASYHRPFGSFRYWG
jgi:quinol monooxygenase YgiN